ncbi:MAG: C-3',4' desaturase CrtD [Flammeovirgaceae bacterium]|jgi:C-3',4' desaturase CrtD
MKEKEFDICVVGSGMAGLTSACLLAKEGLKVGILEQNWLPGGCTSSYWRKGFVFETGATTLVGLDENMPLKYLLEQIEVGIDTVQLELPMQVWQKDNSKINRYQDLDTWIEESEKVFGEKNQVSFWSFCKQISDFVWETSLKQTSFPPTNFSDLVKCVKNASLKQVRFAGYSLMSMKSLLKKYGLLENQKFVDFVNEQLLITAQNTIEEVNVLFGATALCYTNYGNHYVNGGLINLVNPLVDFLEKQGSEIHLRTSVENIKKNKTGYEIQTKKHGVFKCNYLVSSIPINNTLQLFNEPEAQKKKGKLLDSKQLNSAFQMGIGFRKSQLGFPAIHHQIHLKEKLPQIGSDSIFLSLSHPSDKSRCDEENCMVASISTHVHNPKENIIHDSEEIENAIVSRLEELGFLKREDIIYKHSSTPKSWQKWTKREWGFVGGYPQFMKIKPWQMLDARLDKHKAYICGDTTYPGQGIPGATLSGIIAFEKLKSDWL